MDAEDEDYYFICQSAYSRLQLWQLYFNSFADMIGLNILNFPVTNEILDLYLVL